MQQSGVATLEAALLRLKSLFSGSARTTLGCQRGLPGLIFLSYYYSHSKFLLASRLLDALSLRRDGGARDPTG